MFTIIGGDGKEYGPASVAQVRAWIAAGRANLETKAKALGSDEWHRLGDYAEFSPTSVLPPPLPGTAEPAGVVLAERLTRLAAWFIDQIFGFIACLPGAMLLGLSVLQALIAGERDFESIDSARLALGSSLLLFGLVTLLIIQIWMLTTRGQTIGKRLLAIRIVRFVDHANPGFVGAVLLRAIVPGVIALIPFGFIFNLVDIIFIFREDRRCIHDLIAGTKVVKV
ncbi:MAG: RDD family protein [Opitutaceae bacterium]|nr:RDD family protein [Opitutaceae bacterium]